MDAVVQSVEMTPSAALSKTSKASSPSVSFRRFAAMSAPLSSMTASSVCSRSEWVESTELYGLTTAVEIWGEG